MKAVFLFYIMYYFFGSPSKANDKNYYMKLYGLISLSMLAVISCGSYKNATETTVEQATETSSIRDESTYTEQSSSSTSSLVRESILREQSNDSSETNIVIETIWYDTSKANENGISPVQRKETITTQKRHGRQETKDSNTKTNAEGRTDLSSTINETKQYAENSKSKCHSETQKKQSGNTSRPIYKYTIFFLIAVMLYFAYRKYRKPP